MTAPNVTTKKHVYVDEDDHGDQPVRWDVYVDGEYAGWCEARTERRGGYYGDWQYSAAGQRVEWDDTKRSCVKAIVTAALKRKAQVVELEGAS